MRVALIILLMLYPIVFIPPVAAEKTSGLTWSRTYANTLAPVSLDSTSDRGFIMTTCCYVARVIKADSTGQPEWERYYTPTGYLESDSFQVQQTSDRGYLVTGYVCCHPGEGWLLKLDHDGDVQWSRLYVGGNFLQVKQTLDRGYIVAGSAAGPEYPSDGWVLKLDPDGNIVWQEMFRDQDIRLVDQTRDGGFIVAGTVCVCGPTVRNAAAWVFKLDPNGRIVWEKGYLVSDRSDAYSVQQTREGGYIVAGQSSIGGLILRLDPNGNLLWSKSYEGRGITTSSIQETSDRGFIVSGRKSPATLSDIGGPFLLRLNGNGDLAWANIYGPANDFYGRANSFLFMVKETRDRGLIVSGETFGQAWVLKTSPEGIIQGCPVMVPLNATLADARTSVTDTTYSGVTTNAVVNTTGVNLTVVSPRVQTQCTAFVDKEKRHSPDVPQ